MSDNQNNDLDYNEPRSFLNKKTLAIILVSLLGLGATALFAQQKKSPQSISPAVAPIAKKEPEASDPRFLALNQAQNAGVKTCLPLIKDLTGLTIDGESATVSTWNKDEPDNRAFSALSVMKYPNQTAPRAIGLVSATPAGTHCDGSNIRIQSSALTCDAIAANLAKQNVPEPQVLGDVRLYAPNAQGQRTILSPAATNGCVLVFTGTYYGK